MKTKKKLTAKQKRVIILKDALEQTLNRKYKAESGTYIEFNGKSMDKIHDEFYKTEFPSQIELNCLLPALITKKKRCTVCAKGAIVVSAISKFNNYSLADAKYGNGIAQVSDKSQKIMGYRNANLMESYFEARWSKKYPKDHDRLVAILKNAIKNGGMFKPSK